MVSPDARNNIPPSRSSNGWIDRLFITIETFAFAHSRSVILFSIILAAGSIWVSVNFLQFNTSRGDLVSQDLEYNVLYQNYREEFEDFDGMILVVEGKNLDRMAGFAESFIKKLKAHPSLFSQVFYKVDTSYFKQKALFYLDLLDLKNLIENIRSKENFFKGINLSPGLNQLLSGIDREISSVMVDTLLSDFIGSSEKELENQTPKGDNADLLLLVSLLKQMTEHVSGDALHRSPWQSFLTGSRESLQNRGYMVSKDGGMLFVLLNPKETSGDFKGSKNSIDAIRRLIAETEIKFPEIQVGLTGSEVIASDEMAVTLSDVSKASQIALIGVTLLFILVFQNVVKPLMAVFSLILALCWSIGFTALTIGHLNILSVVFTTILIGLGIDFGIHILERYREERARGNDISAALQATIQGTGKANFAGAVTTAIAFGAMTLTDFQGIAELGWIAGFGIIFCLGAMLLLLPALIALEEKWRDKNYNQQSDPGKCSHRLNQFFQHHRWIIGACLATVLLSALAFRTLEFDYNILNLQAEGVDAVQYEMKLLNQADRSTWYAALITNSPEEAKRLHQQAKNLPTVGKVESILSVIPKHQEEKIELIQSLVPLVDKWEVESEDELLNLKSIVKTVRRIVFKLRGGKKEDEPDTVAEALHWAQKLLETVEMEDPETTKQRLRAYSINLFQDYRETMNDIKNAVHSEPVQVDEITGPPKKRFVGKTGKYLVSVYPRVNIWDREPMEKFLKDLRKIDPKVTGNAVHTYESSRLMKEGYIKGGLYAFIAIIIYVSSTIKSFRATLFVLLPVFVGGVWTVGLMELIGVRLNLANLVILPLILGIGVVNGIHITHRYREEPDKTVCVLSKSTGQAVVLSSLTTMIGFGSLMVANHQGVFSLGLVLTLGVGACLIASITLLPALLHLCTIKGWKV